MRIDSEGMFRKAGRDPGGKRPSLRVRLRNALFPSAVKKGAGKNRPQRGFTVIEMIISIVILGILGVYTFSFMGSSMETYVRSRDHKVLYDEARLALRRMADELLDADRSAAITVTPNTAISFTKKHPTPTAVTFNLSGGVLNRISGGQTYALSGNVLSFQPSLDGTTNVITLELVESSAGGGVIRFRTAVYPRNGTS